MRVAGGLELYGSQLGPLDHDLAPLVLKEYYEASNLYAELLPHLSSASSQEKALEALHRRTAALTEPLPLP